MRLSLDCRDNNCEACDGCECTCRPCIGCGQLPIGCTCDDAYDRRVGNW